MAAHARHNLQKYMANKASGGLGSAAPGKTVASSKRGEKVATISKTLFLLLDIFH